MQKYAQISGLFCDVFWLFFNILICSELLDFFLKYYNIYIYSTITVHWNVNTNIFKQISINTYRMYQKCEKM